MFNITSEYFCIFNNTQPVSKLRIWQGIFLPIVPVRIIVPWLNCFVLVLPDTVNVI